MRPREVVEAELRKEIATLRLALGTLVDLGQCMVDDFRMIETGAVDSAVRANAADHVRLFAQARRTFAGVIKGT